MAAYHTTDARSLELQYKIVFFAATDQFVGVAWNYEVAALFSTRPHRTYLEARLALDNDIEPFGFVLRWFDGEYRVNKGSNEMVPAP